MEIDILAVVNGHRGLIVHVVTHGHGAFSEYILQSLSPSMYSKNEIKPNTYELLNVSSMVQI